jgi:hypothetical protein
MYTCKKSNCMLVSHSCTPRMEGVTYVHLQEVKKMYASIAKLYTPNGRCLVRTPARSQRCVLVSQICTPRMEGVTYVHLQEAKRKYASIAQLYDTEWKFVTCMSLEEAN